MDNLWLWYKLKTWDIFEQQILTFSTNWIWKKNPGMCYFDCRMRKTSEINSPPFMWPWTSAWIPKLQLTPTVCGPSSTIRPPASLNRRYFDMYYASLISYPAQSTNSGLIYRASIYGGAVLTNNVHLVLKLLRLIFCELMIRISATLSNYSPFHGPATHWLSPVPDERASLFFLM